MPKNLLKISKTLFPVIFLILASCSLDYGTKSENEKIVPEFIFENSIYNKYEDNRVSVVMEAQKLEQYSNGTESFAENVEFKTFDDEGELDTEGSCRLLSADMNSEKYGFFDDININVYSQELAIRASSLFFDGKTEQLTGGIDEDVFVKQKNTQITGRGFSASAVSRNFSFDSNVSGVFVSEEENETESELNEDLNEENDGGNGIPEDNGESL